MRQADFDILMYTNDRSRMIGMTGFLGEFEMGFPLGERELMCF